MNRTLNFFLCLSCVQSSCTVFFSLSIHSSGVWLLVQFFVFVFLVINLTSLMLHTVCARSSYLFKCGINSTQQAANQPESSNILLENISTSCQFVFFSSLLLLFVVFFSLLLFKCIIIIIDTIFRRLQNLISSINKCG